MTEVCFCPRCRSRTLRLMEVRDLDGSMRHVLKCMKCGLVLDYHAVEALPGECITPTMLMEAKRQLRQSKDVKMLKWLDTYLRSGKLYFVERFDIETGRVVMCLQYDPNHIPRDDRRGEVPTPRQVYATVLTLLKRLGPR